VPEVCGTADGRKKLKRAKKTAEVFSEGARKEEGGAIPSHVDGLVRRTGGQQGGTIQNI